MKGLQFDKRTHYTHVSCVAKLQQNWQVVSSAHQRASTFPEQGLACIDGVLRRRIEFMLVDLDAAENREGGALGTGPWRSRRTTSIRPFPNSGQIGRLLSPPSTAMISAMWGDSRVSPPEWSAKKSTTTLFVFAQEFDNTLMRHNGDDS